MPIHVVINLPTGQTIVVPQTMAGVPVALPNVDDEIVYEGFSYKVKFRTWIFDMDRVYIQVHADREML